jgi:methylmalonyl-CoA/ethylmalonyl-CoA epimerase
MLLNHIGIVNASEEQAEKFYGEFLELEKSREYVVPAELSEQLFSLGSDIKAIVYERDSIRFEIFIYPDSVPASPEIRHVALFVDDLTSFLDRTSQFEVEHIIGKTSEKTVHFIKDYSGNMIEVKQKS